MWHDLSTAFCLMLIIEGVAPFLSPPRWRAMIGAVLQQSDQTLRLIGLASMLLGTALLYLVN
jgi:uncharacterized protein YjeT (DUF2065 family)